MPRPLYYLPRKKRSLEKTISTQVCLLKWGRHSFRLSNFFSFKDKIPLSVVYRYTCDCCKVIYIGKTRRHYGVHVFEHWGSSLLRVFNYTFNPNNNNNTAILNHINHTSCRGKEETFRIIGSAETDKLLFIKETLLIHKNKPKINTNERSTPVYLFE